MVNIAHFRKVNDDPSEQSMAGRLIALDIAFRPAKSLRRRSQRPRWGRFFVQPSRICCPPKETKDALQRCNDPANTSVTISRLLIEGSIAKLVARGSNSNLQDCRRAVGVHSFDDDIIERVA
jgi:hypothetical protein